MTKPAKAFDLSKLAATSEGMYMGRTLEVWKELGMWNDVLDAIGGDTHAISRCYASIAQSKGLGRTIERYG